MSLLIRGFLAMAIFALSWQVSATDCQQKDYTPTLTWNQSQADASLIPATGKIPFAEGSFRVYVVCKGGYKIDGFVYYSGDTNLTSEGITYKLYKSTGEEIPLNSQTPFASAPQQGTGDKDYIIDSTLKIRFFREESSRRLSWSGLKEITNFGVNRLQFIDRTVYSTFNNAIPLSPVLQIKVQRCQLEKVNTQVDLGIVEAGSDGEYVPFSIDLVNCPARTNPEYWGMRVFIDDPNSSDTNTSLLRPANDSVSGYGVGIDVESGGTFFPMKFNTGDTPTLLSLSNYDYSAGTTSINFRAILKQNGDKVSAGKFKATGNLHIVFD
ncbi:fimbrial protein [Enterobacter hormaechei]